MGALSDRIALAQGRFLPCHCGLSPARHDGNLARIGDPSYAGHEYSPAGTASGPMSPFMRRRIERRLPAKELGQ